MNRTMSDAAFVYVFLGAYMLITLAVSLYSMRGEKKTPDDYFLSNR